MSNVDRPPPSKSTSRKLPALQHLKIGEPLFSLLTERLRSLAFFSEGSHVGFGYPFCDLFQFPNSWKPLSAPHALGLLPSELFSPSVIEKLFPTSLSALALSSKTVMALDRRFSGFLPPMEPYPLLLPGCLVRDGTLALLGLLDVPGSPSEPADPKSVSLLR
jgi:hypothetical protein